MNVDECFNLKSFSPISDSGHSTLREGGDNELDNEAFLNDAETMQRIIAGKKQSQRRSLRESHLTEV